MNICDDYACRKYLRNLCGARIITRTANDCFWHGDVVIQDPDDCSAVLLFDEDKHDESCIFGYVECERAYNKKCNEHNKIKVGDCISVVMYEPANGEGLPVSVPKCMCDPITGQTVYVKFSKSGVGYYSDLECTQEVKPQGPLVPWSPPNQPDFETLSGCDADGKYVHAIQAFSLKKDGTIDKKISYYTGQDCTTEIPATDITLPIKPCPLDVVETKETAIITEKIKLEPGTVYELPGIPIDATGAQVCLEGDSCCKFQFTVTSQDPTGLGPVVRVGQKINLGCVKEAQASPEELKNFRIVVDSECDGSCISVTYYK